MYLPERGRKNLSTNQRKGLEAKLLSGWKVPPDKPSLAQAVADLMLGLVPEEAWCTKCREWHEINTKAWKWVHGHNYYCPVPERHWTYVPTSAGASGQGEGQAQQEDMGAEGAQFDGLEERFETMGQVLGREVQKQAWEQFEKDGTLPKNMTQEGKDEQLEKDKSAQCEVTHGKFKCTLKKGHEGDHIAHWSDGTRAKRWQEQKDKKEADPDPDKMADDPYNEDTTCHERGGTKGHCCTKPKDHTGDHVAHDEATGRKLDQWQQKPRKWKQLIFNRCPDCQIDTLNSRLQQTHEPTDPMEKLIYTTASCGCKELERLGIP